MRNATYLLENRLAVWIMLTDITDSLMCIFTDPNVRVACLTCLGSVMSTPTPLLEVCHIIEPSRPSHRSSDFVATTSAQSLPNTSSSGNESAAVSSSAVSADCQSPNVLTPALSSGAQTPGVASGAESESAAMPASWLVRLCVRYVVPQLAIDVDGSRQPASAGGSIQPLPVRLESLQLLALLAKGYFGVLRFAFHCGLLTLLSVLLSQDREEDA
jgi:hypothetical protein